MICKLLHVCWFQRFKFKGSLLQKAIFVSIKAICLSLKYNVQSHSKIFVLAS